MLTCRGLSRTFTTRSGPLEAVRGVDLDVEAGEIVGFLGPNGAGKTTTQRMLTTLLAPTAGSATVAGHDLLTEPIEVRRAIGYVAQGGSTETVARAGEELVDQGRLYRLSKEEAATRGRLLLDTLDLAGAWERRISTLSGGQRRRLDIALGLIHSPRLVFLDEPTAGLDPQSRANLWEHIRALRSERGATVFLTTHYLEEADALCDRLFVIDHGSIVARGTPAELKRSVSGDSVILTAAAAADTAALLATVTPWARPGSAPEDLGPGLVRVGVTDGPAQLPGLLASVADAGLGLAAVEVRRASLDDVFLSLTGRSLREAA